MFQSDYESVSKIIRFIAQKFQLILKISVFYG